MTDEKTTSDRIERAAANWQREGWGGGPHFLAALSIVAVEEQVREGMEQYLAAHGLTFTRHEALAVLYFARNGEMPLGVLSRKLLLHPTSITSTVDTLEKLGLVERVAHPEDRRAVLARITAKGRKVMQATCKQIGEVQHGLGALTEREALTMFRLLRKVRSSAARRAEAS